MKTALLVGAWLSVLCFTALAAEIGMPAPPIKVSQWIRGDAVNLADGRGKKIHVLEFWATWCGPCRVSIPHLTKMQEKFGDKGVVIVGISDEPAETVKPFVEKMGTQMAYTVALDDDRKTADAYMKAFEQDGIPHAFVVDKQGRVAWHGHPMAGLEEALDQMLAGTYDLEVARKAARAEQAMREYFDVAIGGEGSARAREVGVKAVEDGAGSPAFLNEFAWSILTEPRLKDRDLELATRAAKSAYDGSKGKDAAIVDTYARALFDTGKRSEAIELQRKAIEIAQDPNLRKQLEKTLKDYEARAK